MTEDELRDLVLERLHDDATAFRSLIRDLAVAYPEISVRTLETALLAAAREMDAAIRRGGSPTDEAQTARRLAILLSMDIDRARSDAPVTLGDLRDWWTRNDDFFLRL